ncbi:MAG: FkbM family methyltransferase [Sulfuricella sp.]
MSTPAHPLLLGLLQTAIARHNSGNLKDAERFYHEALRLDPGNPDALHLLGLACHQSGRHAEAVEYIGRAIRANGKVAIFHNNMGEACRALGRMEEAARHYRHALRLDPRLPDALNNLGLLHQQKGGHEQAARYYREALAAAPGFAPALLNLGYCQYEAGEYSDASKTLAKAAAANPVNTDARRMLADALREEGRLDEALSIYDRLLAENPGLADAWVNRGQALEKARRFQEALVSFQRGLELVPGNPRVLNNIGVALQALDRCEEAQDYLRRALELDPSSIETRINLGAALREAGAVAEAAAWLEQLCDYAPASGEARFALAFVLLLQGDYARGWEMMEGRATSRQRDLWVFGRHYGAPLWDGAPLAGKTLLVCAEQGAGDVIQFVRFLPMLAGRAGRVVLETPEDLLPLLKDFPAVTRVARGARLPRYHAYVPLLSLPRLLEIDGKNCAPVIPYLHPDPEKAAAWRARLNKVADLKVGLCWAGSRRHANDHKRSVPAALLETLSSLAGVAYYSLQKEKEGLPPLPNFHDYSDQLHDFTDTAALIDALDLVVTVDTSIAHLAGAMGKPVWVLLPFAPDWRWLLERDDSPWYPTARLFRQPAPGAWGDVLSRVRAELGALAGGANAYPAMQPASVPPQLHGEIAKPEGFNKLKFCRHGLMLFNRHDRYVGRALDLYGEFSEGEVALFQRLLSPGDIALDVGANLGAHTVPMARLVGRRGRIYAFEPQRMMFQTLCANLALNDLINVEARQAGLGAEVGVARVADLSPWLMENFGGVSLGEVPTEVPVETVDSLGLERCRLIKIDVEGMEREVLLGARGTLARLKPFLYVECDRREKSADLIRLLMEQGYRLWWHLPPLYNPENFAGNKENVFAGLVSGNLLCAPAGSGFECDFQPVTGPEDWPI